MAKKKFRLSIPNNKSTEDLPAYLKKSIPLASKEFLRWLVGFRDGGDSFSIAPYKNWSYIGLRFIIEVHIDDAEILEKIAQTLGIGKILKNPNRSSALFFVTKFEDITSVLIPIFQEFPPPANLQIFRFYLFLGGSFN